LASNHAMLALLLQVLMMLQGIPALSTPGGFVTGELKTEAGKPAAGIRVAAVAKSESPNEVGNVAPFVGLTETDESGRFRLENIPPGPYYIVAGRVDFPTYYPGVTSMAGGTVVSVTSEKTISGINFAMSETSARTAFSSFSIAPDPTIPFQIQVENGGKLPVFGPGGFTFLRMTETGGRVVVLSRLTSTFLPATGTEYRVTIDNLPDGYSVKAMTYGTVDLLSETLKVPAASVISGTLTIRGFSAAPPVPPAAPKVLSVTLAFVNTPRGNGVRVTGRLSSIPDMRSILISGVPGILYSDGTFEFRNVPPGRHAIVAPAERPTSLPQAASVVVGNQDVDGIQLAEVPVVPAGFRSAAMPGPAGTHSPGTSVPLATLRARIVEKDTGDPITNGTVFFTGDRSASRSVDADGKFEVQDILPGTYSLELLLVGYPTTQRAITVGEEDIALELIAP